MECPFQGKYPHRLIWSGEEKNEFYSFGSVWDYSDPNDTRSSSHHSYHIGRGKAEITEYGSYDEPPWWEPCEYETIRVRAHIKR